MRHYLFVWLLFCFEVRLEILCHRLFFKVLKSVNTRLLSYFICSILLFLFHLIRIKPFTLSLFKLALNKRVLLLGFHAARSVASQVFKVVFEAKHFARARIEHVELRYDSKQCSCSTLTSSAMNQRFSV